MSELAEDFRKLVRIDADAGIGDHDLQATLNALRTDFNASGFREFDRVRKEVGDDLPNSGRVADVSAADRLDVEAHGQPLVAGEADKGRVGIAQQLDHVEGDRLKGHLSRFDARQVQQVVQDGEQALAGLPHDIQSGKCLLVRGLTDHDLGHAEYAVQWRANLVTHHRQEC